MGVISKGKERYRWVVTARVLYLEVPSSRLVYRDWAFCVFPPPTEADASIVSYPFEAEALLNNI
jgi:hypothetical protein